MENSYVGKRVLYIKTSPKFSQTKYWLTHTGNIVLLPRERLKVSIDLALQISFAHYLEMSH